MVLVVYMSLQHGIVGTVHTSLFFLFYIWHLIITEAKKGSANMNSTTCVALSLHPSTISLYPSANKASLGQTVSAFIYLFLLTIILDCTLHFEGLKKHTKESFSHQNNHCDITVLFFVITMFWLQRRNVDHKLLFFIFKTASYALRPQNNILLSIKSWKCHMFIWKVKCCH